MFARQLGDADSVTTHEPDDVSRRHERAEIEVAGGVVGDDNPTDLLIKTVGRHSQFHIAGRAVERISTDASCCSCVRRPMPVPETISIAADSGSPALVTVPEIRNVPGSRTRTGSVGVVGWAAALKRNLHTDGGFASCKGLHSSRAENAEHIRAGVVAVGGRTDKMLQLAVAVTSSDDPSERSAMALNCPVAPGASAVGPVSRMAVSVGGDVDGVGRVG